MKYDNIIQKYEKLSTFALQATFLNTKPQMLSSTSAVLSTNLPN